MIRPNCPICSSYDSIELAHRDFSGAKCLVPFDGYVIKQCTCCGMVYAGDINVSVPLEDYYREISKYENGEYLSYNTVMLEYREEIQFLKSILSLDVPALDMGCGNGYVLKLLQEAGFSNLTGVDPSVGNCDMIRSKYRIKTVCGGLGRDIPEIDGLKFGLVMIENVLEHIVDIRGGMEQCMGYLYEDGCIHLSVPDVEQFCKTPDLYQQFSVEHVNYFTLQSLENLMKPYGLQLVDFKRKKGNTVAIYTLWKKTVPKVPHAEWKFEFDGKGNESIRTYLHASAEIENSIKREMQKLEGKDIYVWGAGTHTAMLFQLHLLDGIQIKGIIDSNMNYRGKVVYGHRVLHLPEDEVFSEYPILISSQNSQDAIYGVIKKKFHLENQVVRLYG